MTDHIFTHAIGRRADGSSFWYPRGKHTMVSGWTPERVAIRDLTMAEIVAAATVGAPIEWRASGAPWIHEALEVPAGLDDRWGPLALEDGGKMSAEDFTRAYEAEFGEDGVAERHDPRLIALVRKLGLKHKTISLGDWPVYKVILTEGGSQDDSEWIETPATVRWQVAEVIQS